jgi:hypothetical protein
MSNIKIHHKGADNDRLSKVFKRNNPIAKSAAQIQGNVRQRTIYAEPAGFP